MSSTTKDKKLKELKLTYQKKQKRNQVAFTAIAIVVIGLSGFLLFKAFYKPALPMAQNVIDVDADMGGFNLMEIHAKVGVPVTVRLRSLDGPYHSDGGGKHQWAVDDFGVSIIAPPEGVAMATFTPTKTGEFTFYCDICCGGRANPSMNGKFIVDG
jgi:cytochrome c oxidase subunit 2